MTCGIAAALLLAATGATAVAVDGALFNDAHFHLTNYIQEGPPVRDFLDRTMGDKVGRVALFGIPLQQTWSYENSGDFAPTYYLQSDAPLYYYSFTDAFIAMAYRSLTKEQQARFDPMITGFNPADMYCRRSHPPCADDVSPASSRASGSSRSTRSSCPRRWRATRPA
jgi:hypothetical protein